MESRGREHGEGGRHGTPGLRERPLCVKTGHWLFFLSMQSIF